MEYIRLSSAHAYEYRYVLHKAQSHIEPIFPGVQNLVEKMQTTDPFHKNSALPLDSENCSFI